MRLDDESIGAYLRERGLLPPSGKIRVEPAGDGNINWVRRVRVEGAASVIVKHARPTLERFPEYRAPENRLRFEHGYTEEVLRLAPKHAHLLPRMLHFSEEDRTLVLEDLGDAPRLEEELLAGRVPIRTLLDLGRLLGAVHRASGPESVRLEKRFVNEEMRRLHGEHIFTLPFEPNGFPVPPEALREAERTLTSKVRGRISSLRERYYSSARALVHADVQPSNILLVSDEPRLLDAEIAHVGDPAFDLGTAIGHLRLHEATGSRAGRSGPGEESLVRGYLEGGGEEPDVSVAYGYAGVEILRRTIGAARVTAVARAEASVEAVRSGVALLST